MKSKRMFKEITKTEDLPQGEKKVVTSRKFKYNKSSGEAKETVIKETTVEKSYKSNYSIERKNDKSSAPKIISSSSSSYKQGVTSGFNSANKILSTSKDESKVGKYKFKSINSSYESFKVKKYTKKESDMIIKIQRWWKRMLAILNGYKIREKLRKEKTYGSGFKNREVIRSVKGSSSSKQSNVNNINIKKYEFNNNNNNKFNSNINNNNNYNYKNLYNSVNSNSTSYTNINTYSNNYLQKNQNSKSYTNINNISSNIKTNLNENKKLTSSSSQKYIQTMSKKVITSSSPHGPQSVSSSPSVKGKYIIETKKVEIFKKPKNYSENKTMSKSISSMSEINRYEVKDIMRSIWNEESYCSTVESLCCLSDDNKSNASQNTFIFEEYEEEMKKLRMLLSEKENELNYLRNELRDTKNSLNVNISKKMQIQKEFINTKKDDFDQDAHELQIISMKKTDWNQLNLPSPVNEIFIESFKTGYDSRLALMENREKYISKIKTEESESVTDREAVLEIQEMNALSIISNKTKAKNICQHLQSLSIFSKRAEDLITEREPMIFQKIEEINITSITPKPRNQIQELDGLEIINLKRPKKKIKNIPQNVDKINIKSLYKKKEGHNMIQELDGLEIIRSEKKPNMPQCVDELEIQREYDMLLVKPTWNSLQIQGSGLNLLAMTKDTGLENQEVDEFEITGLEKPKLYVQKQDKMNIIKPKVEQKITVIVPVPQNSITIGERFNIKGIAKKPEVKYIDRFYEKKKDIVPFEMEQIQNIELVGEEKVTEVQIEEKEVEVVVHKKTEPYVIKNSDRFVIKALLKQDLEYTPVKRKGFAEKINKKVITKKEEKKIESLIIGNVESIEIPKEYETVKPIVLEKIDWNKMTRPIKSTKLTLKREYEKVSIPKQVIKKEEIQTIERVYKNWNDEIKPIKSTKLVIKGVKKLWDILDIEEKDNLNLIYQKEKIELSVENFAFNLTDSGKRFRQSLHIENGGFDLEGNKGIVLKEGPAPNIEIKKEQIILPSKTEGLKIEKIEKKKVELKSINENRLFIKSAYNIKKDTKESIKIVEKYIEKKINWNEFNIIQHSDFNLINVKQPRPIVKQKSNTITLLGKEQKQIQPKIIEKEKIIKVEVSKNWNNLHAQRNAKFGLIGRQKPAKKLKLLVANGDKFFIQKESDDEIIYNDDYNTRKQKQKTAEKEKDKKEIRTQIIKEKEIVPRYQREIRAQIARVKESESETSSLSEIDVLAGIRNKKIIAAGGGTHGGMSMANGYQIKELNGEVIYTAKNGIDLGGVQYQKQIKSKVGYTKKFSSSISGNDMTGIEISFNPNMKNSKNEKFFQKMTTSTGTIVEGNYKILSNDKNIKMKKGMGNSSSYKQMQVLQKNVINDDINGNIDNNGQSNVNKKIKITTTKEEKIISTNSNNNINGQPLISNVVVNNRLNHSPKSSRPGSNGNLNKRPSQNSFNSKGNQSPLSANVNNNINQQMKSGNVVFNSKIKTDRAQYSTNSAGSMSGKDNIIVNSRKEYEKKLNIQDDKNIKDKELNDKKKNVAITFKRSKVKKVEPLRDNDSQKSF